MMAEADDSFQDILVSCAETQGNQDDQDAFLLDHRVLQVDLDNFVECFVVKRLGTGLQDNLHDSWLLQLPSGQDIQDNLAFPDLAYDLHDDLRTCLDLDLPSSVDLLQPSCAVVAAATGPCCQDSLLVVQDILHLDPDLPSYQGNLTFHHLEDNPEVLQDWVHNLEDTDQAGVHLVCNCNHCNLQDLQLLASSAVQGIDDGIEDGSCPRGVAAAAVVVVEAHHL